MTGKDWQAFAIAKIHYLKSKEVYKIYWQRGNGKWVNYDPKPFTKTLEGR